MFAAQRYRSFTQRLSGQHLFFGLVGIVYFGASVLYLSRWESIPSLAAALGVPLCMLLLGSFAIKKTSRWLDNLERQLLRFAENPNHSVLDLRPLPVRHPLAAGWNHLLARVHEHSAWNGVERRLSEAVHSQQAKRWETAFQNLTDGIAICDAEGKILQFNRSFATLLQRPDTTSLLGMDVIDLLSEQVEEAACQRILSMVSNQATQVLEVQTTDDITQGVWRLSRILARNENGDPSDSIWTLRDVTQLKLAEAAREQFVFTATHELRTPLANIQAYSETLATVSELSIEQQQNFYNTINHEANRLARFVDELLNISQMEAGAITIEKHEVQLDRLLNEILESQRPLAVEKKQVFNFSVAPKLPKILADKDKLVAALSNLVSNAIKYTPEEGKVTVRVDSDASRVLFMVEDSGIGISPEDLPKLGGKFFRSKDSRVQDIVGSGLGLAFSQEIARLHGGTISIRSELNHGSCFTLEIPLR
jgi:PAS domain S-box-containing protein